MSLILGVKRLFTWWHGQTLGTQLYTWRRGVKVGQDETGNVYYRSRDGKRRWVIFAGESEASYVPAEWHGWLHHTETAVPTAVAAARKPWQKPHLPNLTGSGTETVPAGSLRSESQAGAPGPGYEAWTPN